LSPTGPDDHEWLHPPAGAVRDAVARAIAEDLLPLGDLTAGLLPAGDATASFVARVAGRLAGTRCAEEAFAQVDPNVAVRWLAAEGDAVGAGEPFGEVSGPLRSVVTAERTALNFLGHLSGIATLTARYVEAAAAAGDARIWDTRKTIPGLRSLAKAAVRAGGGRNHRGNLSDWMLVKDNHLAGMGIGEAVATARNRWPGRTVHVECDTFEQCSEAISVGADAVLLDNMPPAVVRDCVQEAGRIQGSAVRRTLLEVSGGITLETVAAYAATGVDQISVGAITNSAPVLDIGLDL
jgi:nicotinate-nucleotide pyrophosphorylase (carboxylating)